MPHTVLGRVPEGELLAPDSLYRLTPRNGAPRDNGRRVFSVARGSGPFLLRPAFELVLQCRGLSVAETDASPDREPKPPPASAGLASGFALFSCPVCYRKANTWLGEQGK